MTLRIRPVKLKQSIYVRVPNDIADLIGIGPNTEVTLNLQDETEQFLLIYSVRKSGISKETRISYRPQPVSENEVEHLTPMSRAQPLGRIKEQE